MLAWMQAIRIYSNSAKNLVSFCYMSAEFLFYWKIFIACCLKKKNQIFLGLLNCTNNLKHTFSSKKSDTAWLLKIRCHFCHYQKFSLKLGKFHKKKKFWTPTEFGSDVNLITILKIVCCVDLVALFLCIFILFPHLSLWYGSEDLIISKCIKETEK